MAHRTVLRLTGSDTHDFLQGLVSNDVTKLAQGLVYAAMLTPQGKYMADFFLVPDGQEVLLDVDTAQADMLSARLNMYKLRADVAISTTPLHVHLGLGATPEGAFADPRSEALGWRAYRDAAQEEDAIDWNAIYVAIGVPRAGIELGPDTFILEAGFEQLSGVDFRKGCYVGQEVTARMKHKTELRKGLTKVKIDGQAPVGTEILSNGKPAGTLYSQAGNDAIAYLRFDRAKGAMQAGNAIVTFHKD